MLKLFCSLKYFSSSSETDLSLTGSVLFFDFFQYFLRKNIFVSLHIQNKNNEYQDRVKSLNFILSFDFEVLMHFVMRLVWPGATKRGEIELQN